MMKNNIFFLSDASYNYKLKIASIVVKDSHSQKEYVKIINNVKNSYYAEFLALCYAIKIANELNYYNLVFIYDCQSLDINSLSKYVQNRFNFKTVQFLWLARSYLSEPDKLAKQHLKLIEPLKLKSIKDNTPNLYTNAINKFLDLGIDKIQKLILKHLKAQEEFIDYEIFLKFVSNDLKIKNIQKKRTNNTQLYRFFYHMLEKDRKGIFYDYISRIFPKILNEQHFKKKLSNSSKIKHIKKILI